MRTLGIILLSLFVLLGCGRKGVLFLPPQASVQQAPDQQAALQRTETNGQPEENE